MISKTYKVRKAGNGPSMQIMVPAIWAQANSVKVGDHLLVEIQEDRLIVRPMVKGGKTE